MDPRLDLEEEETSDNHENKVYSHSSSIVSRQVDVKGNRAYKTLWDRFNYWKKQANDNKVRSNKIIQQLTEANKKLRDDNVKLMEALHQEKAATLNKMTADVAKMQLEMLDQGAIEQLKRNVTKVENLNQKRNEARGGFKDSEEVSY